MTLSEIVHEIVKKNERLEVIAEKSDTSIEKLVEISNYVSQLLAVHNEKLNQHEKFHNYIIKTVDERKEEVAKNFEKLQSEIQNINTVQETQFKTLEQKFNKFEKIVYMVVGGALVAGFLLNYGTILIKIFT